MYRASSRREQIGEYIHFEVEESVHCHERRWRVVVYARLRGPVVLQGCWAPALDCQDGGDGSYCPHHYWEAPESYICKDWRINAFQRCITSWIVETVDLGSDYHFLEHLLWTALVFLHENAKIKSSLAICERLIKMIFFFRSNDAFCMWTTLKQRARGLREDS